MLKEVGCNVHVDRAERVVQQVHIRVVVDCPRQAQAKFLPTTQVDALQNSIIRSVVLGSSQGGRSPGSQGQRTIADDYTSPMRRLWRHHTFNVC